MFQSMTLLTDSSLMVRGEGSSTSCGSEKSGRSWRVREQTMERMERRPLVRRMTQGYWLSRRMYLDTPGF